MEQARTSVSARKQRQKQRKQVCTSGRTELDFEVQSV